jgi:hypothetical protein
MKQGNRRNNSQNQGQEQDNTSTDRANDATQDAGRSEAGRQLNEEEVRQRAYERFLRRQGGEGGGGEGDPHRDWCEAEEELRRERGMM